MAEQMTLEEYKQKVKVCLKKGGITYTECLKKILELYPFPKDEMEKIWQENCKHDQGVKMVEYLRDEPRTLQEIRQRSWEITTPMSEQMSLEEYKRQVEECLMKTYNCSIPETKRLMKEYEADFQEALNTFSWPPMTMALAMQMGY